jgi:hypothetical protein
MSVDGWICHQESLLSLVTDLRFRLSGTLGRLDMGRATQGYSDGNEREAFQETWRQFRLHT